MKKLLLVVYMFWAFIMNAQNQLPIPNGALESIDSQTNTFSFWSNLQTNGGQVNYSIETENLIRAMPDFIRVFYLSLYIRLRDYLQN